MYEQQPDLTWKRFSLSSPRYLSVATAVKTRYFTRSKEDQGTQSYGIPIFPRDDQLCQQVQCTQCTPHSTPQHTHTPGHGLQTKLGAF